MKPMRTTWQALAWKEWHEHKWKLAAIVAILSVVTMLLIYADGPSAFVLVVVLLFYGFALLAVFLGASDAAGEATRGTLRFTQSLPISMRRVAIAKLFFGMSTCVVPILLAVGLTVGWYLAWGQFVGQVRHELHKANQNLWQLAAFSPEIVFWALGVTIVATTLAISIYIWTLTVGVKQRTEVRACGVTLIVGTLLWASFLVGGALMMKQVSRSTGQLVGLISSSVMPGGFPASLAFALWGQTREPSYVALATAIASLFYSFLLLRFTWLYGASEAVAVRTRLPAEISPNVMLPSSPCRTQLSAVLWKQWRESGPIVLVGLLVVFALFTTNNLLDSGWYAPSARQLELLFSITIPIGFLLALVVGISNFDHDLSPKINEFWRSRPIQVNLWFWSKYLVGLVLLLLALYTPVAIAYALVAFELQSEVRADFRSETAIMLCVHVVTYSAGSAAIILVRQPIYGAILCIGGLAIGLVSSHYLSKADEIRLEWIIYAASLLTAIVATLVAWLAIRQDWGAKSRY